jgi:hypothetical protein
MLTGVRNVVRLCDSGLDTHFRVPTAWFTARETPAGSIGLEAPPVAPRR